MEVGFSSCGRLGVTPFFVAGLAVDNMTLYEAKRVLFYVPNGPSFIHRKCNRSHRLYQQSEQQEYTA